MSNNNHERVYKGPIVYEVRSGDTLFLIARKYQTIVDAIMRLNQLTSTALNVGQRLRIPVYTEAIVNVDVANIRSYPGTGAIVIAQMVRGARLPVVGVSGDWYRVRLYNGRIGWVFKEIVNLVPHSGEQPIQGILGYYTEEEGPGLPSSQASFFAHANQISDIGFFHFRIERANPSRVEKFVPFNDQQMRELVQFGHRHNVKMMPVVHNLLYERGNQEVNKEVARVLITNELNRRAFIQGIVRVLETYNFDGVNIDFEDIHYEDRFVLSTFYRELGAELKRRDLFYSVSVPARVSDAPTNPFSDPFNYAVLGEVVDELDIMMYNEHGWPGSGPGPVVSIGWMERVLTYALTKMPASKIKAAVSVFGFDFNLTTGRSSYATYQMAMNLARRYNQSVIFDQATQTPMFRYQDENGNQHEVWFENADSIRAKLNLAHRMGIRGLALWRLGMEDPEIWNMVAREFVIEKSQI